MIDLISSSPGAAYRTFSALGTDACFLHIGGYSSNRTCNLFDKREMGREEIMVLMRKIGVDKIGLIPYHINAR